MNNIKKITSHIVNMVILLILPYILFCTIEILHRHNIKETLKWINTPYPSQKSTYVILLLLLGIDYFIWNRIELAFVTVCVLILPWVWISGNRMEKMQSPLLPVDLLIHKQWNTIFPYFWNGHGEYWWIFAGLTGVVIGLVFVPFWKIKSNLHRFAMGLIAVGLLITLCTQNIYTQNINWAQDSNYKHNGFIMGFTINIKNALIKKPSGYNENTTQVIVSNIEKQIQPNKEVQTKTPNIIMIMSEAYWDPTLLDTLSYSSDPMPFIRKMQQERGGWMLSPQYGGGTANSEFEVLTGYSVSQFPPELVAYQQYIRKPIHSMASVVKEQNYHTTAIHSYMGTFWNRDTVYPLMGFEKFISDQQMKYQQKSGGFISDQSIVKEIIDQYEKSEKPIFIHAVTMQNHADYTGKRYNNYDIEVNGNISSEATQMVRNYAQGIKETDEAIQQLVEYFQKQGEPTMIVFFGDHLPMLGREYQVYKETGLVAGDEKTWDEKKMVQMHSTPYFIWSNFKDEKAPDYIGASFLGAYAMQYANIKTPAYYQYLNEIRKEVQGHIREVTIAGDGKFHFDVPEKLQSVLQQYWLLQYDQMFGKQYSNSLYGDS